MVSLVGMAIVRQFTLRETSMGKERMSAVVGLSPLALTREYVGTVRAIIRNRQVAIFLVVRNLAAFAMVMWATYSSIYLTDSRGIALPKSSITLSNRNQHIRQM